MDHIREQALQIRLVVFDVDGVLTDGSLFLGDDGQEYKSFNSRDGHGMKMLMTTGVEIAIITGRTSDVVSTRMKSLGIRHVYQGRLHKLPAFEELLQKLNLSAAQAAYVGDDVVDLPIMSKAGLSIAVADAHLLVQEKAHWTTQARGGRGAGREVCDMIMSIQGTIEGALKPYL